MGDFEKFYNFIYEQEPWELYTKNSIAAVKQDYAARAAWDFQQKKIDKANSAIDFFLEWAGGFDEVQKKTFIQFDVWQQMDIYRNPQKYQEV